MSTPVALPSWPPAVDEDQKQRILSAALDYALGNALVLRPPADSADHPPSAVSVIHGPFALFPTPFPRKLFEHATALQRAFNAIYAHVTCDDAFLTRVIGGAVARVDTFQGRLWQIWETVRSEGIHQDFHLGLFRSDYMLHQDRENHLSLQQVEFNTISSSFGPLACKTGDLHRYLLGACLYPPHEALSLSNLPENNALDGLCRGLAAAHKAYGNERAVIVMVVQEPERNAFDQRSLEWRLQSEYRCRLIRMSFPQLADRARLGVDHALEVTVGSGPLEVAVVYFRAGYTPNDYPTEREWATRLLIERSRAIKCPSVALQLAGAKKVQQVLSEDGVTETFVGRQHIGGDDGLMLRSTYTSLYPLDDSPLGQKALRLAKNDPEGYVLKPQREGGGNNIYKADIPPFLDRLAEQDRGKAPDVPAAREGYILMDLIRPPFVENIMCPAGQGRAVLGQVISELGVYGICLFRSASANATHEGAEILLNEHVGHLLRTKAHNVSEGGVATGFSVLDSPLLLD